jgi:hypothetical protein
MAQRINNAVRRNTVSQNLEKVYLIADALYEAYREDFEDRDLTKGSKDRNILYGVLMNSVGASGKSLQEVLGEDDASHASNLAIQKIAGEVAGFAKKVISAF